MDTRELSVMLLAIFVLATAVAAYVARHVATTRLNPVALYGAVWLPLCIVCTWPTLGILPIQPRTWVLILVGSCSLYVGAIAGGVLTRRKPGATVGLTDRYDEERILRASKLAVAALGGYYALQLYSVLPIIRANGGLGSIFSGGGFAYREALTSAAHASAQTAFTQGSLPVAIAGYVLFLGHISLIWGPHIARAGHRVLGFSPLAIVALYSLVSVQRAAFLYPAAIFAASWYYDRKLYRRRVKATGTAARTAITAACLVVVVLGPVSARNPQLSTVEQVQQVGNYYLSGVAGLNQRLVDHEPAGGTVPGWGAWTFSGATSIVARLGVPVPTTAPDFSYVDIQNNWRTGLGEFDSNIGTWLIYPWLDFGIIGLAAMAALLGALAMGAHLRVVRGHDTRWIGCAAVLLAAIGTSFFSLTLVRDFRYTFLVVYALTSRRAFSPAAPKVGEVRVDAVPPRTRRVLVAR